MSKESMIIGRNSVTEALRAGRSISKIYLAAGNQAPALERIRELAGERGILIENVPPKVLHRLAPDERHQGVVAMAAAIDFADLTDVLADVEAKEEVLVVLS